MKHLTITLALAAGMSMPLPALDLEVTPGSMTSVMPILETTSDTSLKLSGSANAADLSQLKYMPSTITRLDMSGLTIEGGEIPASMLTGSKIKDFIFPAGITAIGASVFAATPIESIAIPAGVTKIGDYAFANCKSLTTVTIPADVTTLGKGLFKDCTKLSNLEIGNFPKEAPASIFDGCTSLSYPVPAGVEKIGDYAWRSTPLESITLVGVQSIGAYAFANMPNLIIVNISNSEELTFGAGAFFGDTALSQLPDIIGTLSPGALAHTSGRLVTQISTPVIPEGAFANNSDITGIKFTKEVRSIGDYAFRGDTSLGNIDAEDLNSNIPEVTELSFSGLENEEGLYPINLNVTPESLDDWKAHPVWGLFRVVKSSTGIVNTEASDFNVNIARNGESITINATSPIERVAVYSVDGMQLAESMPASTYCEISGLPAGDVLLVQVSSGKAVTMRKLK
ncbi:MAG: leucine-rich repeat domain-containing protein [Muribaculaceae bacterium]|nr:leucine-rich repeat domain-containing protein [Muribaculaceae bacterium]